MSLAVLTNFYGKGLPMTLQQTQDDVEVSDIDWAEVFKVLRMSQRYEEFADAHKAALTVRKGRWAVPMLKGLSNSMVVDAYRRFGINLHHHAEDLDVVVAVNDRDPADGSYVVSFARSVEPDRRDEVFSADELANQSVSGATLLERSVLGFGYVVTTGSHLDEVDTTLCIGSRFSNGEVPSMCFKIGATGVFIGRFLPSDKFDRIRARIVTS